MRTKSQLRWYSSSFPKSVWERTCLPNSVSRQSNRDARTMTSQTECGNEKNRTLNGRGLRWWCRFRRLRRTDCLLDQCRNSFGAIDDLFRDNAHRFLDKERRANGAVNAAASLAALLSVIRVQLLERNIHDVLFAVHHAALPEFSLGRHEKQFVAGGAGPLDRLIPQQAFLIFEDRLVSVDFF